MSIFIASDHAGYGLKQVLLKFLKDELLLDVVDLGCNSSRAVDYPDFAKLLVRNVKSDKENRGILLCGTGVGMTITANRTKGIRCALCHNAEYAKLSKEHNNSNVIAIGARFIDENSAKEIVKAWLDADFTAGRHKKRVDLIDAD